MTNKQEFYILAIAIGLVQGGIQALSRSYYSRLIPKNQAAEYYGFYNMLGKFAAILGPVLMGSIGLIVRRVMMPPSPTPEQMVHVGQIASRWGIASILLLFIIGAILFQTVRLHQRDPRLISANEDLLWEIAERESAEEERERLDERLR